jgi:hypothetical protein
MHRSGAARRTFSLARHTTGYGHIFQGALKVFRSSKIDPALDVIRHAERNAFRANLVSSRA